MVTVSPLLGVVMDILVDFVFAARGCAAWEMRPRTERLAPEFRKGWWGESNEAERSRVGWSREGGG